MKFTDEDLKRLKEYHSIDREFHANSIWIERDKLKALLHRLEAAEAVCMETDAWDTEAHIAWRSASGKEPK